MITLEFKKQTGQYSQSFKLTPSASSDKAALTAALNEALGLLKNIALTDYELDNTDDQLVKSLTFGIDMGTLTDSTQLADKIKSAYLVTPSDTEDLDAPGILFLDNASTEGTVKVELQDSDGIPVTFDLYKQNPGRWIVRKVYATGTTATRILISYI